MCYHSILLDCWLLPVGPTFKHAWAAAFFPGAHANMSVSRTAARSPLKYLTARSRLCRLGTNMPLQHAKMNSELKYLTAKSCLCRFGTNMPLKHANMSGNRTAARSPLNTWQPDHGYAGLEQKKNSCTLPAEYLTAESRPCRFWLNMVLKHAPSPLNAWQLSHLYWGFEQSGHLNMPKWAWAEELHAPRWNTWQPSHVYAGLEQTCHLNMPTWAWAEQLHAPRWIPYSQVTSMQVLTKHAP